MWENIEKKSLLLEIIESIFIAILSFFSGDIDT